MRGLAQPATTTRSKPPRSKWSPRRMKLTLPADLAEDVQNASARLGVKPRTAGLAAVRLGLERLTFEDVEAEAGEEFARERQLMRAAELARAELEKLG
jgi:hypothetical protein